VTVNFDDDEVASFRVSSSARAALFFAKRTRSRSMVYGTYVVLFDIVLVVFGIGFSASSGTFLPGPCHKVWKFKFKGIL
jgi:hypothetical protein